MGYDVGNALLHGSVRGSTPAPIHATVSEMSGANEKQIQFWNDEAGQRWVSMQEQLDEELEPIGRVAMERLGVHAGSRVLDIGCGCGATSFELARRGGPASKVVGVDISGPMLARARQRLAAEGLSNVELVLADAQVAPLPESDLAFSRFGVMFFEDPVAAFANVRRALSPSGRLGFVCWRSVDENPLMYVGARAAAKHIEMPAPPPEGAPGPFSFADGERPRRALEEAGFSAVDVASVDVPVQLGLDLDAAASFFLKIGPAAAALRTAPDPAAAAAPIATTVREMLRPFVTGSGLSMTAAVWIVTASNE